MKDFVVYAHRGASEYAPENTFMSFYLGMYMGANGIETDVQITKDGILVLFHDDTIERVTGQKGKISDYTYKELCDFNVYKNKLVDKIPTFEDFLAHFCSRDITFAIELKSEFIEKQTIDLIEKYKVQGKCIITSFIFDNIIRAKKYSPNFKVGYLIEELDEKTLKNIESISIEEICPPANIIDKEMVDKWHKQGYSVRTWGVANMELAKKVYDCGVDGTTVNFPDKLIEYIKSKNI